MAEQPAKTDTKWDPSMVTRLIVTALMTVLVAWWLYICAQRLGVAPTTKQDGTVIYDEFGRAKDILTAVLPLLTLALGYWTGAAGADKAEKKADVADKKVNALLAAGEGDLLTKAKNLDPGAFGIRGPR